MANEEPNTPPSWWRRISLFVKVSIWAFAIGVLFTGIWLASSMIAYLNGPIWLALVAGLAVFPGLPFLWEFRQNRIFRKKQRAKEATGKPTRTPWFGLSTRLMARSLALNLCFIAALLSLFPQAAFTALATRGDWFVDEVLPRQPADTARSVLFGTAELLEWVYLASADNPYAHDVPDRLPAPTESQRGELERRPRTASTDDAPPAAGHAPTWPLPTTVHPVVASMPDSVKGNYRDVANHLKTIEDPFERIKAMHDFIVLHVEYDYDSYRSRKIPPQDPDRVFAEKTGVCSGYAKLLAAMGEVTGDEVVVISGDARTWLTGDLSGEGHAWNAVKIDGRWYFVDLTWDDMGDEHGLRTDYLFAPPDVLSATHLPDDPAWQLRDEPLSRAEFLRAPSLMPQFHALGLKLISPRRSQVVADDSTVRIKLTKPSNVRVLGQVVPPGCPKTHQQKGTSCQSSGDGDKAVLTCDIPRGQHVIYLFAVDPKTKAGGFAASFHVNSR